MARLITGARGILRRYPFVTNSAIYGSLYVGAEFSQQILSKRWLAPAAEREEIDYVTIGRYAVMGTAVYAPTLYAWYKWLDKTFPGTTKAIIFRKLVLDQFILTPYLLTVFYAGMSIMEGSEDILLELREKFLPTFVRSCIFWLPAQVLNFSLVAPRFRVIYMGVCGLIWVNILCWIKRQSLSTII
ncbi:mpv17-like protein isoform X1 [Drosophila guanche]|uniref:Blast:Mpv17-like protein n=2 Tax=Drosophila guanche TaxID=7266 RepID=A0A3B0K6L7_DROGU|nr:mpv17-like protein isoform X1 [Drosophila guanche]SPP89764.1 blast:Mpv17-like protein [Drosophila guanche]